MSAIERLTPHMGDYRGKFSDTGDINWVPYLMYFHPFEHRSDTVNTDTAGFRYSEARGVRSSVADLADENPVCVIAGSSTVFGIGASADKYTLSSRMTLIDPTGARWENFGGRSFNSTQELILFALEGHRLPQIERIVLFSGFNNLGLARLPDHLRGQHGGFFLGDVFQNMVAGSQLTGLRRLLGAPDATLPDEPDPPVAAQIDYAATLTARHLGVWKAMADAMGAKLTFVLQPLANWVRETGTEEEELLFAELEEKGGFAETYGDILAHENYRAYAGRLQHSAQALGIGFIDFAPLLMGAITDNDWVFVDRIHFTDLGHGIAARLLIEALAAEAR